MYNLNLSQLLNLFSNYQNRYYPELMGQPVSYYFMALTGEYGELANVYKKLVRSRLGINKENQPQGLSEYQAAIIEEYAGTLKYLAIVGAELAKDLGMTNEEFSRRVVGETISKISNYDNCDFEKSFTYNQ
jgi:hypothetical protein